MTEISFTFTAEEVNSRSVLEGTPPELKLYKIQKGMKPVEGKIGYTTLLRRKLKEVTPAKSNFTVSGTFKDTPHDYFRCYVHCQHDKAEGMPVTYEKGSLKENSELIFTITVKCSKCLEAPSTRAENTKVESIGSPLMSSFETSEVFVPAMNFPLEAYSISLLPPTRLIDVFKEASKEISTCLFKSLTECASSENPLNFLAANKVKFGQAIGEAWYRVLKDVQPEQKAVSPVHDHAMENDENLFDNEKEEENDFRKHQLPVTRNAHEVLSGAAKRLLEQRKEADEASKNAKKHKKNSSSGKKD